MGKQQISVTTDCVIFSGDKDATKILLVKRKSAPFKGMWALPGGFLDQEEPLIAGAQRELFEETGLVVDQLQQFKAFGRPGRDPRGRTISIVFYGRVSEVATVKGADDAEEARWFFWNQVPELAFDHSEILDQLGAALKIKE